jgi:hypothetical protein
VIEEGPQILKPAGTDPHELVRELQPLCDVGMVCDFTLRDASCRSAVLIGVSSTAVIVDGWDEEQRRPAGEPYVLALDTIDRVTVP